MICAPYLADLSLSFQSADYFLLMILGLSLVTAFAEKGDYAKALIMTCLGLSLATVGTDLASGVERFTFGRADLIDGISFLLVAMATFALTEAFLMVLHQSQEQKQLPKLKQGELLLTKQEVKEIAPVISRSSLLGFLIGVLPGTGATIASFLAYAAERTLAGEQSKAFGKGSLKGLSAPEAANNAACSGSFVPLLTLGIPGSGTTAILLGALISYGIQPGPRLYLDEPALFWSVVISMYFGNLILLLLNLPLIPYIARLLLIPRALLVPLIIFFSLTGVYLISFNTFDLYRMLLFTLAALFLRQSGFPMAPLLLGFILGGMLEDNLRRAMNISQGDLSFLWDRPSSLTLVILISIVLLTPLAKRLLPLAKTA
jgi:putative tricarboxylic transport membrane protein